MKSWWQDWEVSHLATKAFGIFSSFIASKLAILTTTPEYAHFWASWSLSAPTIIDKGTFEAKLATTLGIAWLSFDHFVWKFIENQKVTGSPTIQVEKAAPPQSPNNPVPLGTRAEDPKEVKT
jgi:hypothetical protein